MLVIRPIEQRDLPTLKQIAIESGHGFTSLPVNDELLQNKIDHSLASFASRPAGKGECLYFFVAEDSDTGEVLGTSALDAAVGLSSPFYTYLLGKQVHSSPKLGIYNVVDTLTLTNDYTGVSELCTLFLRESARKGLNGRLLSKCRFMFLAEFSELFDHRILAEMRGVSDERGSSPFWSWLQEHFFSMDFPTVDYLTGIGQKGFIADLMPKYPIYVNLLSKEARAVIGKTHDKTRPALRLLEEEGFSWRGYVDIFDAGPSVECDLKQIRTVRNSRQLKVHIGEPLDAGKHLISNTRFDGFRALIGDLAVNEEKAQAVMTEEVARLLKVEDGDTVRVVEMNR
ncbi:arginine N-succinyltransferase [Oceanisphaera arctica]|uniref:Arginine N-succinyltransferase n=1 Tax=Oceanisphaera arctica TaxID=641510 RepID=A0A2P5TQG1_9GAMM|nr:arginine N-succinyltransferase [Oceanisphaera arctica]PPL17930.1 arginine N-succinyltransferase [Oceanisphaera arctica]GHA24113.1 arginine N-succinyltransferase [Oceanisphaera arctica]